ncbi:DUF3231 family protein [Halobacillus shinanisalinarum]|uniref:DUF3231 family protein n=1 Tax=Halobacillus shinanisalinarum TaxID=2932258 RepID=UPI0037C05813
MEYVQGKKYLNPFKKRSLNTVEISHLLENVKTNVIGEKLCTGFAQTTKSPEIKSYLKKGKKFRKSI